MSNHYPDTANCSEHELFELVYDELRNLAQSKMVRETPGHTLQPTALVHEAYLRLVKSSEVRWENRQHFFSAAGQAMQRILIDRARRRDAAKRGGGWRRIGLDAAAAATDGASTDIAALGSALEAFEKVDPRACQAIRLRYLVGLSAEEIAEILQVSPRTVNSDLLVSKAWLKRCIQRRGGGS